MTSFDRADVASGDHRVIECNVDVGLLGFAVDVEPDVIGGQLFDRSIAEALERPATSSDREILATPFGNVPASA
jgi:hypothetical protein